MANGKVIGKALETLRLLERHMKGQDFDSCDRLMSELQQHLNGLDLETLTAHDWAQMQIMEKRIRIIARGAVINARSCRDAASQMQQRQHAFDRLVHDLKD